MPTTRTVIDLTLEADSVDTIEVRFLDAGQAEVFALAALRDSRLRLLSYSTSDGRAVVVLEPVVVVLGEEIESSKTQVFVR